MLAVCIPPVIDHCCLDSAYSILSAIFEPQAHGVKGISPVKSTRTMLTLFTENLAQGRQIWRAGSPRGAWGLLWPPFAGGEPAGEAVVGAHDAAAAAQPGVPVGGGCPFHRGSGPDAARNGRPDKESRAVGKECSAGGV